MKFLKYAGCTLLVILAILAARTSVSLEGCSPKQDSTYYYDENSPKGRYESAKNEIKYRSKRIGDEAGYAAENAMNTGRDLAESGKYIAGEAAEGTVNVAIDAKDTYVGFLSNMIGNIKKDWKELLISLGGDPEKVYGNDGYHGDYEPLVPLDEYEREQMQDTRDAWEKANKFSDAGSYYKNIKDYRTGDKSLPNASDNLKKKIYRLPHGKGSHTDTRWISC